MIYFVPDEAFSNRLRTDVQIVLERRGSGVRYEIRLLPEVEGVTYRGAW